MRQQAQHGPVLGMAVALFTLAACSSPDSDKTGAPPPSGAIAAGTYSNAVAEGDGQGWRVTLARGEASNAATIAHCTPECGPAVSVPVRMGMGGLMAEYQSVDGRTIPLAIRPHGDGIEVAADWGEGMESAKLLREVAAAD